MKKTIFFFLFFLCSCNFEICPLGELNRTIYEKCKRKYENKFAINYISCEMRYIDITLKDDILDSSSIRKLGKDLLDENNNLGWRILSIYNKNRKYLCSYSDNRKEFYISSGD